MTKSFRPIPYKRIFSALMVTAWLSFYHLAAAQTASSCRELFAGTDIDFTMVERMQKESTGTRQNVGRRLKTYIQEFQADLNYRLSRGIHKPDFHWLDVGGGLGLAPLESFHSAKAILEAEKYSAANETEERALRRDALDAIQLRGVHQATVITVEDVINTFRNYEYDGVKELLQEHDEQPIDHRFIYGRYIRHKQFFQDFFLKVHDLAIKSGRYRYLTGRYFEDYKLSEIGLADVITDNVGAFSYSPRKFEVLRKYAELLKPGGAGYIQSIFPEIILKDGSRVSFDEFLKKNPIPGIHVFLNVLYLNPVPGTIEGLKKLESTLVLESAKMGYPVAFVYSEKG